jgi:hypothetical protein
MELNLTSKELEVLLSLTAQSSHLSEYNETLWRKVSKEFFKSFREAQEHEEMIKRLEDYTDQLTEKAKAI